MSTMNQKLAAISNTTWRRILTEAATVGATPYDLTNTLLEEALRNRELAPAIAVNPEPLNLTAPELAAVLTGLRLVQLCLDDPDAEHCEIVDRFPNGLGDTYLSAVWSLTTSEIDALCGRLNAPEPKAGSVEDAHQMLISRAFGTDGSEEDTPLIGCDFVELELKMHAEILKQFEKFPDVNLDGALVLEIPNCPVCGCIADGTVDEVVAQFESFDGTFHYCGDTDIGTFHYCGDTDINTQTAKRDPQGRYFVACQHGHQWATVIKEG